jgi:hypothetical protein
VKFNMGCGHNRLEGHVNVDAFAACAPDEVIDLERTPWPWPDNCAEEIVFNHSLEHMGADPRVFLAMMTELYRICAPEAAVRITVPHPRHDTFIGDPTHVRIITPAVMSLFDRALNDEWQAAGASNSPLAHYLNVDFVTEQVTTVLDEPYASQLKAGVLTQLQVVEALRSRNNVAREIQLVLRARKPS